MCGREFTLLSGLRDHEKNCGKDPYKCAYTSCNYRSKRRSALNAHIKRCNYKYDKPPPLMQCDALNPLRCPESVNDSDPDKELEMPDPDTITVDLSPMKLHYDDPAALPHPEAMKFLNITATLNYTHALAGTHFVEIEANYTELYKSLDLASMIYALANTWDNLVAGLVSGLPSQDKVQFRVTSKCGSTAPVSTIFVPTTQATGQWLMDKIHEKMIMRGPKAEFVIDDGLIINFVHQPLYLD